MSGWRALGECNLIIAETVSEFAAGPDAPQSAVAAPLRLTRRRVDSNIISSRNRRSIPRVSSRSRRKTPSGGSPTPRGPSSIEAQGRKLRGARDPQAAHGRLFARIRKPHA
jgi:hypothetical protein